MQDFSFGGKGTMNGGEYSTIIIDGIAECTGTLRAEHLHIDGIFKCAGAVAADVVECDGAAEFRELLFSNLEFPNRPVMLFTGP